MLVPCGYILNDDQLKELGAGGGLTIEHHEIHVHGSEDETFIPVPFDEHGRDRQVKRWLERYGIRDTVFVMVLDPYFKILKRVHRAS